MMDGTISLEAGTVSLVVATLTRARDGIPSLKEARSTKWA